MEPIIPPEMALLEVSLQRLVAAHPQLRMRWLDDLFELRLESTWEWVVKLGKDHDDWTLWTPEWHGHYSDEQDLVEAAILLLGGYIQTVEEFKGDKLSATWAECYDEEGWTYRNVALFLNPFARDHWELEDGEEWRCVSRTIRVIDAREFFLKQHPEAELGEDGLPPEIEVGVEEWYSEEPQIFSMDTGFVWFENRLGRASEHMRWATDVTERFCLQVPYRWTEEPPQLENRRAAFKKPEREIYLYIDTFFRETPDGVPEFEAEDPVRPQTVEMEGPVAFDDDIEWTRITWTLMFSNGQTDMMVHVYLAYLTAESESVPLLLDKSAIEEALRDSYLLPG